MNICLRWWLRWSPNWWMSPSKSSWNLAQSWGILFHCPVEVDRERTPQWPYRWTSDEAWVQKTPCTGWLTASFGSWALSHQFDSMKSRWDLSSEEIPEGTHHNDERKKKTSESPDPGSGFETGKPRSHIRSSTSCNTDDEAEGNPDSKCFSRSTTILRTNRAIAHTAWRTSLWSMIKMLNEKFKSVASNVLFRWSLKRLMPLSQ